MADLKSKLKKPQKYLPFVFGGIVVFAYFAFFLNRGITLYDEGYITESSYLTFLGKIPYKDFYFQYTPLTAWLGAAIFKIFGVGILQLRWLALLVSLATVLLGYLIADKIGGKKIAILAAIAVTAWGFPHANFLWPSSLATLFLFLTIFCLINKKYSLAGISVALTLLAKQNLGLILLVATGIFVLFRGKIRPFLLNLALIPAFAFLILISTNPNLSGFTEFFYRSSLIAKGEALTTWYPALTLPPQGVGQIIKWIVKTFLYYSPLVFIFYNLIALFKDKKRNIPNLVIFTISTLFFFTMIWPTTDLAHFTFAVPALIISFVIGTRSKDKILKIFSILCISGFLVIGFYKTLFMSYYTFETPYLKLNNRVTIRGEEIIVDDKSFAILDTLNKEKDTIFKDKSVFVYSYAPMIYFILDKTPPTTELYTVESLLSKKVQNTVVSDLDKYKVDVVILESWREANSDITKYIRSNYQSVGSIWDFEVLSHKIN